MNLFKKGVMTMQIIYDSMTGNVRRFVEKLLELDVMRHNRVTAQEITPNLQPEEEFVLITYTTGFGQIPKTTQTFLETNRSRLGRCIGVVASGNRNWGDKFAASGDEIENQYNVDLLWKIELAGTNRDLNTIVEKLNTSMSITL